jgi:hypothetical protein
VTECTNDVEKLISQGPIPVKERQFLVNGWRWHTMSVIRDLERFEMVLNYIDLEIKNSKASLQAEDQSKYADRIRRCNEFVIGFNWKALMRVERELFFPWLQKLLPPSAKALFTEVYNQHDVINSLSDNLAKECKLCAVDTTAVKRAVQIVLELKRSACSIQSIQEKTFVPYVASYVNKNEQEKFNRRVISRLGLIDSQAHLVSMTEAIKGVHSEENLFKAQIPKIAQVTSLLSYVLSRCVI